MDLRTSRGTFHSQPFCHCMALCHAHVKHHFEHFLLRYKCHFWEGGLEVCGDVPLSPIQHEHRHIHTHTQSHLKFLVPCAILPSASESAGCFQSLLSRFTLGYWLLWRTSSHVLLFSTEHHQNSENELFWFGVSLQLQRPEASCHTQDN